MIQKQERNRMNKLNEKDMDLMLSILKEVWKQNSDLRLGQLLLNLNRKWLRDFYYISDNVLYYNLVKEYYETKEKGIVNEEVTTDYERFD